LPHLLLSAHKRHLGSAAFEQLRTSAAPATPTA